MNISLWQKTNSIKQKFEFNAIRKSQKFDFMPGYYQIELFGAQGGSGLEDSAIRKTGGLGAKVSFVIQINYPIQLFFYVGSKGSNGNSQGGTKARGGWNGGGDGGVDSRDDDGAGAGGGSTDLRIIDSTNDEGIRSRIAVAAAGSGSAFSSYGAPGGDLYIYKMNELDREIGYQKIERASQKYPLFQGQNGRNDGDTPSSGAGGGYYGGTTVDGGFDRDFPRVGTGGSSYVAGCNGEDEMTEQLKKLGIQVLYWSATPGLPSIGHEGDGLATVLPLARSSYESNMNLINIHIPITLGLILV